MWYGEWEARPNACQLHMQEQVRADFSYHRLGSDFIWHQMHLLGDVGPSGGTCWRAHAASRAVQCAHPRHATRRHGSVYITDHLMRSSICIPAVDALAGAAPLCATGVIPPSREAAPTHPIAVADAPTVYDCSINYFAPRRTGAETLQRQRTSKLLLLIVPRAPLRCPWLGAAPRCTICRHLNS